MNPPNVGEFNATSTGSPAPHGGRLTSRLLSDAQRAAAQDHAREIPSLELKERSLLDIEMLAVGAYSPLTGFMGSSDYNGVVNRMRLANGSVWSLPVVLGATVGEAVHLREGNDVALLSPAGIPLAILHLKEKFSVNKTHEAQSVFKTTEALHPGVAAVIARGDVLLGGEVDVISLPPRTDLAAHRLTPAETRAAFAERGWKTIAGFQTRNPLHRAHEAMLKSALETCDGLLLHPVTGAARSGDIPVEARMRSYEALIQSQFPGGRVLLGALPINMHYAGPREALWHALIRKNFGCTHFIVGRDHAGVGGYYGPLDAQRIFSTFTPEELGITPIFFDELFWCRRCGDVVTGKKCVHPPADRLILAGNKARDMLRNRKRPPVEFMRPEVADVLIQAMPPPKAGWV